MSLPYDVPGGLAQGLPVPVTLPVPVRQWRVRPPGVGAREHTFEDEAHAWRCAAFGAMAGEPSVIRVPEGEEFIVFTRSDLVELSTRHVLGGNIRKVVDLP